MEAQGRERRSENEAYKRFARLQQAIVDLLAAHEAFNSPEIVEQKIQERRAVLANADSLDLHEIAVTVLDEDRRQAELQYDRALDNLVPVPARPGLDIN